MEPSELLRAWEREHQVLGEKHRASFLARPTTRAICAYPDEMINRALAQQTKLDDILELLEADSRTARPAPPPHSLTGVRKTEPKSPTGPAKKLPAAAGETTHTPPASTRRQKTYSNTDPYASAMGSGTVRDWSRRTVRHVGKKRYCPACGLIEEGCRC